MMVKLLLEKKLLLQVVPCRVCTVTVDRLVETLIQESLYRHRADPLDIVNIIQQKVLY